MSLISKQIQKLRDLADDPEIDMYGIKELNDTFKQAADTIEALSTKLASANMERLSAYYNVGWIPVEERLPDIMQPVLICDKQGRVCIRTITCKIKGKKYWSQDKYDVIAWMPLPEPYKE